MRTLSPNRRDIERQFFKTLMSISNPTTPMVINSHPWASFGSFKNKVYFVYKDWRSHDPYDLSERRKRMWLKKQPVMRWTSATDTSKKNSPFQAQVGADPLGEWSVLGGQFDYGHGHHTFQKGWRNASVWLEMVTVSHDCCINIIDWTLHRAYVLV